MKLLPVGIGRRKKKYISLHLKWEQVKIWRIELAIKRLILM